MKYLMKFRGNNNDILPSSDYTFLGRELNIPELKERFNNDFIKNTSVKLVEIFFLDKGIHKSFVAGYRDNIIVICDMDTKKEYSPKEFSKELNTLQIILDFKEPILYLQQ